ncbi:uncharacterized protein MYCFIDRAFT_177508 [Pseudocercospora fijiensis CIRAD86]|uniref:Uncharacterized protein n=1 Tax=Pseudocercospora fijiensis (strain CIRAD86) TaxID=383855 RepID=M2ZN91_PSEFD|nr:uncharacterized protein MYCFIDRAFT_177508 [Pseudocercospora fijiensis CIRAD86]EME80569.1 hypothetical protein MYCFIDRAFT_177508 [Pseudocercospora fijiensis CIRAD86]
MVNQKRKKLLGTPQWDDENRATAHLLFVLYDLWPDHQDDLINIFHRMFPHFQRIRFTASHLRDAWYPRWAQRRFGFVTIDRPNEYNQTQLNQAELNDLATLTSIIQRWATTLGITLRPAAPAITRPYDDGAYDFSQGIADPNDNLTTYLNKHARARAALRPGDVIPQRVINLMTVGNQVDTKLQYGMPVDGLAHLPSTVGFDVDEEGQPLNGVPAPQVQAAPQAPAPATHPPAHRPAQKQLPYRLNGVSSVSDSEDVDMDAPVTRPTGSRSSRRPRRQVYDDDDEDDDFQAPPAKKAQPTSTSNPNPPTLLPPRKIGLPFSESILPRKQIEMYRRGLTIDGHPLRPMGSGVSSTVHVPGSPGYTWYTGPPGGRFVFSGDVGNAREEEEGEREAKAEEAEDNEEESDSDIDMHEASDDSDEDLYAPGNPIRGAME